MSDLNALRLDDIDRQLIAALQLNARESVAMLARKLGIARTTVISRIARLEKNKVITGYGLRLGQRVLDGGLQAYVGITLQPRSGKEEGGEGRDEAGGDGVRPPLRAGAAPGEHDREHRQDARSERSDDARRKGDRDEDDHAP